MATGTPITPEFLQELLLRIANLANSRPQIVNISDKRYPTFDVDKPVDWDRFVEALEMALSDAMTTEDAAKRRVLLHNNGDTRLFNFAADILKTQDKKIQDASYDDIKSALKDFFSPRINPAAAYAKFINVKQ